MKKYEFTDETITWNGRTLHRIKALRDFSDVAEGELGGFIEKEENLDHDDDAWVYDDARVYGDAWVYDDACVYDDARVYGDACVYGDARVYGDACVYGNAEIFEKTHILTVGPIGSRNDITTFFRTKDLDICVRCGCFDGNLDDFLDAVEKTHGARRHGDAYRMAATLARLQISGIRIEGEENHAGTV